MEITPNPSASRIVFKCDRESYVYDAMACTLTHSEFDTIAQLTPEQHAAFIAAITAVNTSDNLSESSRDAAIEFILRGAWHANLVGPL